MTIYLIRHTQPDVPEGICYGQTNLDIAESFAIEVDRIKAELDNPAFTHCFSSPLQRCFKLAQALSGKKLIHTDDRLMELNFGDWEMKPWEEIRLSEEAKFWHTDFLHTPSPKGESYGQLQERIKSFSEGFKFIPDDSEVLIVTHSGPIRSFMTLLEGADVSTVFDQIVDFGSIHKMTYHNIK